MNRKAAIIVVVMIALMVYAGWRSRPAKSTALPPGTQSLTAGEAIGHQAPDFVLDDLQGKKVKLSDFRGKAVLLNFWATWCGPCKVEMPWFVELQKQYGPQGLEIVGVALDDSGKDAISKFAKDMGVNYTILQGQDAVGDAYGAMGLPTSFFIDRNGKIVESASGLLERSEIEGDIRKALASDSNAAAPPAKSAAAGGSKT
jgi:thiol-disulfide isomerase/thioredoxin